MANDQTHHFVTSERTKYKFLFGLVDLSLYATLLNRVHIFLVRFWFFFLSQLNSGPSDCNSKARVLSKQISEHQESLCHGKSRDHDDADDDDDDGRLDRDEVKMVMAKLGLYCNPESEDFKELGYGCREICGMFEEEEAKLEEVKEAFDVFDENGDGFIEPKELQRVLSILGLKEAIELENCHKMVAKFDENGDGRIDFEEFVKIMDKSYLC